ncbi:MAG: hypothetical protein UHP28_07030 [Treponema sp.]|nr:hypothetical protein [Treponema sp.]
MEDMSRIAVESIKLGTCYSEPVYFEDGKNMFLPSNHPAEEYHLTVLRRWHIPFLLTHGTLIKAPVAVKKTVAAGVASAKDYSDVEDLIPV